jgi:hypothetical protein
MRATLDIPGNHFRRAKAAAERQGIPLHEFAAEAIADKLESKPAFDQP